MSALISGFLSRVLVAGLAVAFLAAYSVSNSPELKPVSVAKGCAPLVLVGVKKSPYELANKPLCRLS
jgi:hypothetical protein